MKNWLIARYIIASALLFASGNALAQDAGNSTPSKDELVQVYSEQNWERSKVIAQELLKSEPDNTDYLSILGIAQAQMNQLAEAEAAFEKVKALKADDAQVYSNLCSVKNSLKRADAVDICLEATKRIQDNPELFYITAQLLKKNKPEEAFKLYESAYQLSPSNIIYLTNYTSMLSERREYKKVVELTEKAIQSGLERAILYLNIILACNRMGDYESAIKFADEGNRKFDDPGFNLGKAEALNGLKRYEEADAIWAELESEINEKAASRARLEIGYARSLLARACTSEQFKTCAATTPDPCCEREKKALPLLESAQTKAKDFIKRESSLTTYLGLARALNNKLEDAEALLTEAANNDISQDNAGALAALAITLYQFSDDRDHEAGRRYYAQALEASPDFADVERVRETRAWPPRMLETLKKIQDDVAAEQSNKTKKSGCGCDVRQGTSTPWAALLVALLSLLSLLGLRRKNNAL